MRHSSVRSGLACGITALAFALAGCGGGSSPTDGNGNGNGNGNGGDDPVVTTSVSIDDIAFNPADIQVSPGATVTWTWDENVTHNVTFAAAGIQDSEDQSSDTFAAAMPTTAGVYDYECTIHAGMDGSVTVE